jgi:hypothetical protein
VWVSSQWGLYWYAQKAGAQVLRSDDVPAPGDYLVRGQMEGYPGTLERLPPAVQIETFTVGDPGGRTMSLKDGAGLYGNGWGNLMWAWGTGEWNITNSGFSRSSLGSSNENRFFPKTSVLLA